MLKRLEHALKPDVDGGLDVCGDSIEGVGHHQEVVGSHGEELPVVGPGCQQGLVHLKHLGARVPPVDHTVYVVVVVLSCGTEHSGFHDYTHTHRHTDKHTHRILNRIEFEWDQMEFELN